MCVVVRIQNLLIGSEILEKFNLYAKLISYQPGDRPRGWVKIILFRIAQISIFFNIKIVNS